MRQHEKTTPRLPNKTKKRKPKKNCQNNNSAKFFSFQWVFQKKKKNIFTPGVFSGKFGALNSSLFFFFSKGRFCLYNPMNPGQNGTPKTPPIKILFSSFPFLASPHAIHLPLGLPLFCPFFLFFFFVFFFFLCFPPFPSSLLSWLFFKS